MKYRIEYHEMKKARRTTAQAWIPYTVDFSMML